MSPQGTIEFHWVNPGNLMVDMVTPGKLQRGLKACWEIPCSRTELRGGWEVILTVGNLTAFLLRDQVGLVPESFQMVANRFMFWWKVRSFFFSLLHSVACIWGSLHTAVIHPQSEGAGSHPKGKHDIYNKDQSPLKGGYRKA